ncbi:hypothetical protein ACFPU0_22315 [Pseudomonas sp. GCM10022186]|uniref:hypothetical protein n=1 Tax=Pseudomonas sp. GCM10022186 TaxID=3252650 RepID=UPI00361AB026
MKSKNLGEAWVGKGKTIRELIEELGSFEDKDLLIEISFDGGKTSKPISLVGKKGCKCLLIYLED